MSWHFGGAFGDLCVGVCAPTADQEIRQRVGGFPELCGRALPSLAAHII